MTKILLCFNFRSSMTINRFCQHHSNPTNRALAVRLVLVSVTLKWTSEPAAAHKLLSRLNSLLTSWLIIPKLGIYLSVSLVVNILFPSVLCFRFIREIHSPLGEESKPEAPGQTAANPLLGYIPLSGIRAACCGSSLLILIFGVGHASMKSDATETASRRAVQRVFEHLATDKTVLPTFSDAELDDSLARPTLELIMRFK